jgi:membrane protein YdbS with pleckstrin-like domain
MAPGDQDRDTAKTGRMVAVVIAVTMILWMGAQWAGKAAGLHPSYAFLFDLAALAALVWSLVVIGQMWRRRNRAGK